MESVAMDKFESTVNVDGGAIKLLREQQSLTQLYVAKMVGVTTDTISRWENNRYPTIKRINAERLAEALEVSIDDILSNAAENLTASNAGNRHLLRKLWLLIGAMVCLSLGLLLLWLFSLPEIKSERVLPSYGAPSAIIPVQLRLSGAGVRGVVRETLPRGWSFIAASPQPDSVDPETGLIRWIVQLDEKPFEIYYLVKVPTGFPLNQMAAFDGELIAHAPTGRNRCELIGANKLVVAKIHWADLNGDGLIDDDEMLDASYLSENMPNLPLDLDAVEELWIEEQYYWNDELLRFVPGILPEKIFTEIDHNK
jgi:transcriptional regulator with XRE-family HTH domain